MLQHAQLAEVIPDERVRRAYEHGYRAGVKSETRRVDKRTDRESYRRGYEAGYKAGRRGSRAFPDGAPRELGGRRRVAWDAVS